MTRLRLTSADQLRDLPDGVTLTGSTGQQLTWVRAFAHPHPDPDTGLWTLPRNPFTEWHVDHIDVDPPDTIDTIDTIDTKPTTLDGDEPWLSTLTDPHDTTQH